MTSTNSVYHFDVILEGWSPAGEVFPVVNENSDLVGGFTVSDGPIWKCFVSARGYPESLAITSGNPFYVTPITESGAIVELRLSMIKINEESKLVTVNGGFSDEGE